MTGAINDGSLDPGRLAAHRKLAAEQRYLSGQKDVRARIVEKRRWKQISKSLRDNPKR